MFHNLRKGGPGSYFKLELDNAESKLSQSGRSMEISSGGSIEVLSKTSGGELEEGNYEIAAQKRAAVRLGKITPIRCNPIVEVNPLLYADASVDFQRVYDDYGTQELVLYVNAKRKINLADLDWLLKIYATI